MCINVRLQSPENLLPAIIGRPPTVSQSESSLVLGHECAGPAAVGFDHVIDFGHWADGFFQGDDDLPA
jgi:hypothetical protein